MLDLLAASLVALPSPARTIQVSCTAAGHVATTVITNRGPKPTGFYFGYQLTARPRLGRGAPVPVTARVGGFAVQVGAHAAWSDRHRFPSAISACTTTLPRPVFVTGDGQ